MGVNLLNLGTNSLLTAQNQLATTSHNIANVNTEGYNRQRVTQETTDPFRSGGQFIGTGASISSVDRVFNQFRFNELTFANSANSFASRSADKLGQLDETMSKVGQGITNSLNDFYSSINSLVDSPADVGIRELTLSKANTLTENLNSMQRTLENQVSSINEDLAAEAAQVTSLGQQLALVNRDIVSAKTATGSPNDLLDKRDQLLQELATLTNVSTVETKDGALGVYIGNGQTLVTGVQSFSLGVAPGHADLKQQELVLTSPNGIQQTMQSSSMGGSMGALLTVRDGVLTDSINQLGLTSLGLADAFNQMQAQGLNMDELAGQNFFNDINSLQSRSMRVLADDRNSGNLTGGLTITDVSALTGDDYELSFDGTNYNLNNLNSGVSQTFGAIPFSADGFTFDAQGGAASAGDKFVLQPTRQAAAELSVELTNPKHIAASSVVEISPADDNVSSGQITLVSVDDMADANFPADGAPLSLEVYRDGAGVFQYQLKDSSGTNIGAAGVYTPPSQQLSMAGMTFEIAGEPIGEGVNAPEQFTIEYAFGAANNNNAKAMADLQTSKSLNGGRSTINDTFENNVIDVGAAAATAQIEANASTILFDQATERVSSASGVNIDEEASNLLRFQQAYSASARVITTANEIFQTLLQASA